MQTRTRGRTFTGIVVAARMQHTATVEWPRRKNVQKYERYEKARTRVKAHNPPEINAQEGDIVRIVECKPLSKTKHFIITEKIKHEKLFAAKQELQEEGKVRREKKQEKGQEE
ncbi:30S ribosomal protein S17 [Candidatus Woesearchaeota archaeon CG10_big_fil_rev_8_21_14_0_10_37_12]|nr:MAG: 30S ribosomal protein S17 [Candidatus Woesearchaeota archaeon CG10_big_fil_rev_8_21_14_0_10_37_12]